MSRADNTAHLRRAAADRHDAATRRTIAVIDEFDRNGTSATVAGVASAAGVARSWLYEQPDLLAATIRLRDRTTSTTPLPAAQRATDDSLRQRLDAARADISDGQVGDGARQDAVDVVQVVTGHGPGRHRRARWRRSPRHRNTAASHQTNIMRGTR